MSKYSLRFQYRSGNDGREAEFSDSTGLPCPEPTLAQQQFKDDCNLNSIMERYTRTGELAHFHDSAALFGDFTSIPDFHSSLNIVIAGQATFDALPALIRKRFDNDPSKFLEFSTDPANRDELRSMGLLKPASAEPSGDLAVKASKSPPDGGKDGELPRHQQSSKHSQRRPKADSGGDQGED